MTTSTPKTRGGLLGLTFGAAFLILGCSGVMDKIKGAGAGGEEQVEAPAEAPSEAAPSTTGAMTTTTVNAGGTSVTTSSDGSVSVTTPAGTVTTTADGSADADEKEGDEDEADDKGEADDKDAAAPSTTAKSATDDKDEKKDEKAVATVKATFTVRGGGRVGLRGEPATDASWTGMVKPGKQFFNVWPEKGPQKSLGVDVEAGRVNTFCYDVSKDAWCSKH